MKLKKMQKRFAVLALGLAVTFGVFNLPVAAQVTTREGQAATAPINQSGIRALINVTDNGTTNSISGFATGMDPAKAYVSLFYDTGSVATGPNACLPTNPSLTFSQMVIGYWMPLTGTTVRTLVAVKVGPPSTPVPLAYVPLNLIGTISVREDTQVGTPLPPAPDPNRFQLRSCGRFRINN